MTDFYKYHGTGNDFIVVDDRISKQVFSKEQVISLCDRHFGIGADGLILIRELKGFDFEMIYYNSDGEEGSMCGNGGRCAVAFTHSLGIVQKEAFFKAYDGGHRAEILSTSPFNIKLHMKDVSVIEKYNDDYYLNTGSPHYCLFVSDVSKVDVLSEGKKIRYSDRFKAEGTNVNFIELKNNELHVRTYERGVESETLSCGTGVTAAALAANFSGRFEGEGCVVHTPGGKLKVSFMKIDGAYKGIWLEGPVVMVFRGWL